MMLEQPFAHEMAQFERQAKQDIAGLARARLDSAAKSTFSMPLSLSEGMTGATSTVTGMPAWESVLIVASRRDGVAARGSISRASFASSVVTESATLARPFSAIGARMIDVARHERRLRHDADRVIEARQHFEHPRMMR